MSCFSSFQNMCKKIVSPTRHADFDEHQLIQRKFKKDIPPYQIFLVPSAQGKLISVLAIMWDVETLPTVLYLHGNGGHKMEGLQLADGRVNLVAMDFGACGKSQGEYITYGQRQARDVAAVVTEVKRRYGVKKVSIWGRSMGASIGIMYASLFPRQVSSLVLDTPFRWLKQVVRNVAKINNSSMPNFVISLGLSLVEGKVEEMVGLNIFATDFKMYLNLLQLPALFIYSRADTVVMEDDVKELYKDYKGFKELKSIDVLHHEDRPKDMTAYAIRFIVRQEEGAGWRSARSSTVSSSLRKGLSMSIRGRFHAS